MSKSIVFSICIFFATNLGHADEHKYTFGVFPYVTPAQLVKFQRPLKDYFELKLGRSVNMVTAPNFKTFVERTHNGSYDFILTAPHLARLAEKQKNYQRIALAAHHVQGVYLVRLDSDIGSLDDMHWKTITMAAPLSVLFQMGEKQLRQHGLINGKNITIRVTRTHNNAMHAPLRRESEVSLTGLTLWKRLGKKKKLKLKPVATTPKLPGLMLMAHPRIDKKTLNILKTSALEFYNTSEGRHYYQLTGFKGFTRISNKNMADMDPFIRSFVKK